MEVIQVSNGKTVVFVDGQSLFITAKTLGFSIDFKKLLDELKTHGDVIRTKYYTLVDDEDENSPLIPLTDWLSYNGYSVVIKYVRSYVDPDGRKKMKGNIAIEIAVDMMEIAPHVDHVVLISGDGDFSCLLAAVQRQGKKCTVISSVQSSQQMCSASLRKAADQFIELAQLRSKIERENNNSIDSAASIVRSPR